MKCIYHAFISHVSRYSLGLKKVSSRSRLGHSRVSSRSRLGQFGKRLGLVSVSGAQVSVLVSVSTQKVLSPSLQKPNTRPSRTTHTGTRLPSIYYILILVVAMDVLGFPMHANSQLNLFKINCNFLRMSLGENIVNKN